MTELCELKFVGSRAYPLGAWTCHRCGHIAAVPWERLECPGETWIGDDA